MVVGADKRIDLSAHADSLPQDFLDRVDAYLRLPNPKARLERHYSKAAVLRVPEFLEFARFEGNELVVPRGTPLMMLAKGTSVDLTYTFKTKAIPVDWPEARLPLRDVQRRAVAATDKSGILLLPTAAGKTITGLAVAANLGQRTLVIVHRGAIFNAWVKDLKKFYGAALKPGDVGIIRQKDYTVGNLITLTTVQTMSKRDVEGLKNSFGLVILDEAHHAPARIFMEVIEKFKAFYRVAITADMDREDGLGPVVKHVFGPIIYQEDEDVNVMPVTVKMVATDLEFHMPPSEPGDDVPFDFHGYVEAQITDPERNALIGAVIAKEYAKGRSCLVLSTRVPHVKAMATYLQKAHKIPAIARYGKGGFTDADESAVDAGAARMIVSTVSLLGEGVNCPRWDRLFLIASIKSRLGTKQVLGRIRRTYPGKKDAVAYDFVDVRVPVGYHHWRKRQSVYHRLGFKVDVYKPERGNA